MTYARSTPSGWVELSFGQPIIVDNVATSYDTMLAWSLQYRTAQGIKPIEDMTIPAGKVPTGEGRIEDRDGKPVRVWDLVDAPPPTATNAIALIEAEKLRRIEAGFPFAGKVIQSRAEDRENIAGAKSAAQDAKLLGAMEGELDWQKKLDAEKGAPVFAWITLDNSLLPLDADSMIEMGYAAMLHKQAYIFAAKGLKDRVEAGETIADVTADEHWPG